jgi:hypothetical protein
VPTLSELTFAYLRRQWAVQLCLCEEAIRPETPLEWYVPKETRPAFWDNVRRQANVRMPTLELSPTLSRVGWWLSWAAAVRGLIVGLFLAAQAAIPLAVVSFVATAMGYFAFTRRWATEHPEIDTFGDLSRWILARNLKRFRQQFNIKPNRDEIFATVKAVLVESCGVEPAKVTMEASFVNDLGLD